MESKAGGARMIQVEVAYALPDRQTLLSFEVPEGTTAAEAVRLSGIAKYYPDVDFEGAKKGIFSKALADAESYVLKEKDRVEVYRDLLLDPMEIRRRRAEKVREKKGGASSS